MPGMFSFLRDLFASAGRPVDRSPAPPPVGLQQRLIQLLEAQPLPPELVVAAPRPDVWGTTGKLGLAEYHSRFKPLLLNGFATTGLVYDYKDWGDADERTVHASYAWLDQHGRLRTHLVREEYDPHVGWNASRSTGLVDIDAELSLNKAVTIVQDLHSGLHVIYEYLRVNPRWNEELKVFSLQWKSRVGYLSARAHRSADNELLFTIEQERSSDGGWRLFHGAELQLRSTGSQPLSQGGLRRLLDAQGMEIGQVQAKDQRLQITLPPKVFFLTEEPNRQWMIRNQDGERVLGTWLDDKEPHLWHLVAHTRLERPLGERLVLTLITSYHGAAQGGPFQRKT